jgi:hypothetical protein
MLIRSTENHKYINGISTYYGHYNIQTLRHAMSMLSTISAMADLMKL